MEKSSELARGDLRRTTATKDIAAIEDAIIREQRAVDFYRQRNETLQADLHRQRFYT